jgi:3-phenylpropionate/trans-cinnamate dioxygenase ferredoxin reductase subunit
VRVLAGRFFGGQSSEADVVHACQCRVISDLAVAVDDLPDINETSARVADLVRLAPDVVEVCVQPDRPVDYLPGQYMSVQFRGFPARNYSPTVPLDWPSRTEGIRFHIRQIRDGKVSSALGRKIVKGHRLRLTGPFGSAYLRPNRPARLILVSSGTGFAPIWAIAEAAIWERPDRKLELVVGARSLESFYMIPALCRLALFPRVTIISVVSKPQTVTRAIQHGYPSDYLPPLCADDIIYAAGAPVMVEAVMQIAKAANVTCFTDPFSPKSSHNKGPDLLSRAADWFSLQVAPSPPMAETSQGAGLEDFPSALSGTVAPSRGRR